jgi:hypothetical protein
VSTASRAKETGDRISKSSRQMWWKSKEGNSPLLSPGARCQSRSVITLLGRDAGGPRTVGGAQGTFGASESVLVIWMLK